MRSRFPTRTQWLGPPADFPARRIVSLVPSLSEAVFQMGAGDRLVGRTDYCVRPAGEIESVAAVGGTKNADAERIRALKPDLILANKEENVRKRVLELAEHFPVWLTDPHGPEDVPALWEELGRALGLPDEGARRADDVARAIAATGAIDRRGEPRPRFVYFVWKDPWMVAGHDTYISRLLRRAGFDNALPEGDDRFPAAEPASLASMPADVFIYSTEPYAFELPRDLLPSMNGYESAGEDWCRHRDGRLSMLVDAVPLSWYPSQTVAGLKLAGELRERVLALTGRRR